MYKKLIAAAVSASMICNYVPIKTAAGGEKEQLTSDANDPVSINNDISSDTQAEDKNSLTDFGNTEHAYDPFAELEAQQAEQEIRENTDIIENTVIFSVKDQRSDDETAAYLVDTSALCMDYSLKAVEMIYESEIADDTYEVFYQAATNNPDIWKLVDSLSADDRIISAEPDYVWESAETVSSYKISEDEYNNSTHFPDIDLENVWNDLFDNNVTAPGSGTVVAVIDTGVDYTHADLKDNMWINTGEIAGNGIDDDGNGYIDDIYGYDFVENDADPMDDMGHGTHVSGIIAMSKNNTGGVGIAYGSKIMAIKAGQSDGTFSSTDIDKAVKYAVDNGADVINMSFGGTGKSNLVEAALKDAFSTAVLVASAGNDGSPTTDAPTPPYLVKEDIYPAGYSYVIGVMATDNDGSLADFSNWDYNIGANCEYELAAPGVSIYSTLPNECYAYWSGTSMAAPNVSAAAAIIRSKYKDKTKYTSRYIMGQLTSATTKTATYADETGFVHTYPYLNIIESLTSESVPDLLVRDVYIFDNKTDDSVNNNDGIVQPGEIIDIGLSVLNKWGTATDVTVKADVVSVDGDDPYIEFVTDEIALEDIGTFEEVSNGLTYLDSIPTKASNPLRFKIKDGTPNDTKIQLNITVTAKNGFDSSDETVYTNSTTYTVIVQNSYPLSGVINEDMTLTADKYWIIENGVRISGGVTVTVEPGTQIQFWSNDPDYHYEDEQDVYIQVDGQFIAEGTEENPIEMFPGRFYEDRVVLINSGHKKTVLKYVNIINGSGSYGGKPYSAFIINEADHCRFVRNNYAYSYPYTTMFIMINKALNCSFKNYNMEPGQIYCREAQGCIYNNVSYSINNNSPNLSEIRDSVVLGYRSVGNDVSEVIYCITEDNDVIYEMGDDPENIIELRRVFENNAILRDFESDDVIFASTNYGYYKFNMSDNYWGTDDPKLVKKQVYDADVDFNYNDIVQEPFLTLEDDMSSIYPFMTEAYITDNDGNRIDTVDGGQTATVHIKFNRDMAQDIQPMVTYGGSEPYTDFYASGDWVSAREWTGEIKTDKFINSGRMYIRTEGAAAADDRWLVTGEDSARFFFEIADTEAHSIQLRGEGCAGHNLISWSRMNTTLLPATMFTVQQTMLILLS